MRVLLVVGKALANLIAVTLRHGMYETLRVTSEDDVRAAHDGWHPDMAFVDIDHHRPLMDVVGGGILAGSIPILALTRKRDTAVKLAAFEHGADDVIEVPFTLDEIIARPFALMRRARRITVPLVPKITLGGQLVVDLAAQTVTMNGGIPLELTPIQQTLLYVLAANAGDVLSREELLSNIWGSDFQIESNVVDRHIRELRVKLGDDWRDAKFIETIPGRGYRFKPEAAAGPRPTPEPEAAAD